MGAGTSCSCLQLELFPVFNYEGTEPYGGTQPVEYKAGVCQRPRRYDDVDSY